MLAGQNCEPVSSERRSGPAGSLRLTVNREGPDSGGFPPCRRPHFSERTISFTVVTYENP